MKLRLFLLVIINIIFITSTAQAFQIDIAEKYNKIFTNKILDDFIKSCSPKKVSIIGDFNVRGGVKTIVKVEHKKSKNKRKT